MSHEKLINEVKINWTYLNILNGYGGKCDLFLPDETA